MGTVVEDPSPLLPPGVTLGPGERLVVLTRETLVRARADIPRR